MSLVASLRGDSLDFPLFVHVLGAMILVGGLVAAASALGFARGDARLLRLGYWALLGLALPGWVLMRAGGDWIYSREGWDDLPAGVDDPGWLNAGALIADAGGLVLLVSLVAGGIGVYQLRAGKGAALLRTTLVLSLVLLAAYVVAVWAMTGKPG
jgi:hypothetical protein